MRFTRKKMEGFNRLSYTIGFHQQKNGFKLPQKSHFTCEYMGFCKKWASPLIQLTKSFNIYIYTQYIIWYIYSIYNYIHSTYNYTYIPLSLYIYILRSWLSSQIRGVFRPMGWSSGYRSSLCSSLRLLDVCPVAPKDWSSRRVVDYGGLVDVQRKAFDKTMNWLQQLYVYIYIHIYMYVYIIYIHIII